MNQVCVDMRARLSSKFRHVHHGINRIDSTHNSGAEVTTSCHNVFPTENWRTFSNEVSWSLETFGAEYDCLRVEWTEAVSALEMPSWDVLHPMAPPRWNACCSEVGSEAEKYLLRADIDLVIVSLNQRHCRRHLAGYCTTTFRSRTRRSECKTNRQWTWIGEMIRCQHLWCRVAIVA